jgi:hypothetical protein
MFRVVFILTVSSSLRFVIRYTAANGREFLAGLALREQRNPQYDFLKPTHMLFSYFTSLVDAYAKILNPPNDNLVSAHNHNGSFQYRFIVLIVDASNVGKIGRKV